MSVSITAVDRALDILLCFNDENPRLSLSQIAGQLNLPKSTIHRHLATLENKHFINRDENTGMYHLGLRFVEMAALILQEAGFQRWTQPYLERLSIECGETVDLAVLDGTHVIYLQVIESPQRVKIAAAIGQRLPAYCTASGKAFLAFLPEEQVREILPEKMTRYTENTCVSLPVLYEDLRATRERGFAISEQEYEKDINAVAAPILDVSGYPVAVIAVAGPSYRLSREQMNILGKSIRQTAEAITREGGLALFSTIISNTANPGLAGQTTRKGIL
jgi:IclR family transcriptional regulator, KDG regulon repressor